MNIVVYVCFKMKFKKYFLNKKEINYLVKQKKTGYTILFYLIILLIFLGYSDNEQFIEKNYECKCVYDELREYKGVMNCTAGLQFYCEKFRYEPTFFDKLCL